MQITQRSYYEVVEYFVFAVNLRATIEVRIQLVFGMLSKTLSGERRNAFEQGILSQGFRSFQNSGAESLHCFLGGTMSQLGCQPILVRRRKSRASDSCTLADVPVANLGFRFVDISPH